MKTISIYDGKNRFSEIVANAAKGEPQVITKNGKETAVIISIADFRRLKGNPQPLEEFLLNNPARKYGIELDLKRDKSPVRPGPDFSEDE